jgi:hypothetical protein
MIRMHMSQQHGIDRLRIDTGGGEVALNEAGGRQQIIARTGIDNRQTAFRMD